MSTAETTIRTQRYLIQKEWFKVRKNAHIHALMHVQPGSGERRRRASRLMDGDVTVVMNEAFIPV